MSKETLHAPFRADVVGSFLRPAELKAAREQFAQGQIDAAQLRQIEDKLIAALIEQEKRHGIHAFTDGEYRRAYWHLDFFWGLNHVEHIELEHGYQFHGEETTKGSIRLTGKIGGKDHPFVNDYRYIKQFESEGFVARQTIPAPAQFLAELFRGDNASNTRQYYPDDEELINDIAAAYRQVIRDLYNAGCRNLQLDDCTWGMIVDRYYWSAKIKDGSTLESEAEKYLRVNNLTLENRPADLVVNTHICRGNYHSCYACSGAYDPVAPYVFAQEHVDGFYLEYDDERSGGFEPLSFVPKDKKVVLGLVTTKSPVLEDADLLKQRIADASHYFPLEQLCLSPQCGFASCEIGNKLSEVQQWAKVDLVNRVANEVWG
jgi:5-methyltetrahydropteroyltriglutamate--homocysteine methyltransferase